VDACMNDLQDKLK